MHVFRSVGRAALAVVVAALGCVDDGPASAGLLVRGASRYTDDVGGFAYSLVETDCADGERVADAVVHMATVRADGGEGPTYGEHYFTLVPGCYDVTSQPLRGDTDEPSEHCLPAHARGVQVSEGLTTELELVSQCLGRARTVAGA